MTDRNKNAAATILDIVRVRCAEATFPQAEAVLRELLQELSDLQARLVRSATAPHDLALHLRTEARSPGPVTASTLGLRVAASLRDFGPVHHGVWIEIEPTPTEEPT